MDFNQIVALPIHTTSITKVSLNMKKRMKVDCIVNLICHLGNPFFFHHVDQVKLELVNVILTSK